MTGKNRGLRMIVLAVAALATGLSIAYGAESSPASKSVAKSVAVQGILIDTKCYSADNNNIGNDHGGMKGCGTTCARSGIPVGILIDGKKGGPVLILLAPAKAFAEYIGMEVKASGTKPLGDGALLPEKVEVKGADGTFKAIDFSSMM